MDYGLKNQELHNQLLINNVDINDCLRERYCNGIMGVPITFMDKYNPSQFKIIGLAPERLKEGESQLQIKRYRNAVQHKKDDSTCGGNKVNDGPAILHNAKPNKYPYYTSETVEGKYLEVLYARVLIERMI